MPERPQIDILLPRAMHTDFTRRLFLGGLVGAGATAALAACAPSTGGGGGGGAGGVLNLYTWGPYDDPKVLKAFAGVQGGATIKLGSYDSNQEMIAKLVAAKGTSGYDLVVPTIGFIPQMVAAGLLEKLDHSKLPNLKNVESTYLNLSFDKGNVHSVPKDFGATGFAYDTTVIKRDLTSWKDFFDAAQKEASGHTSLVGDPDEVLWAYFLSIGEKDINTSDTAKLNAARDWLVKNISPHIQKFESYPSDTIAQNGVALAHAWNGDARQGILGNKTPGRYKFVKPSEGASLFLDTWAIPTGAKNVDAAHTFINYVLDPDVSFKELKVIGYDTAVKGVAEKAKADPSVKMPELIFYTPEEAKKLVFDIVPKTEQQRLAIYNDIVAAAG